MNDAIAALAALAMAVPATPDRLPPIERCTADASFIQFRDQIRGVIARKDGAALMELLADDVMTDLGGGQGKKAFGAAWDLDHTERSPLWQELQAAIGLGCAPAGDALVAPSLIVQFPDQLDAFETLVALPGTKLRAAPDDLAPVVATLDWHVLTVVEPVDVAPWSEVRLADGRKGYVRGDQVRSPIDYRAAFEKRGGKWLLTAFIAGD